MRRWIRYLLPGLLLAVIVACGTNAGGGGGLIEIGQALNAANGSEVTVSGFLIVDTDGNIRLCSLLLESSPPQCGGDRIDLRGIDVRAIPNTKSVDIRREGIRTITWTDDLITLKGIRETDGLREVQLSP